MRFEWLATLLFRTPSRNNDAMFALHPHLIALATGGTRQICSKFRSVASMAASMVVDVFNLALCLFVPGCHHFFDYGFVIRLQQVCFEECIHQINA